MSHSLPFNYFLILIFLTFSYRQICRFKVSQFLTKVTAIISWSLFFLTSLLSSIDSLKRRIVILLKYKWYIKFSAKLLPEFLTLERNTYRPDRALEVQLPHLHSDLYFSVFPITLSFIHSGPATPASLLLVRLVKHIHPHTRALILAHSIWYIFLPDVHVVFPHYLQSSAQTSLFKSVSPLWPTLNGFSTPSLMQLIITTSGTHTHTHTHSLTHKKL